MTDHRGSCLLFLPVGCIKVVDHTALESFLSLKSCGCPGFETQAFPSCSLMVLQLVVTRLWQR